MNLGSIIVLVILMGVIFAIVGGLFRRHREGKPLGCDGCSKQCADSGCSEGKCPACEMADELAVFDEGENGGCGLHD